VIGVVVDDDDVIVEVEGVVTKLLVDMLRFRGVTFLRRRLLKLLFVPSDGIIVDDGGKDEEDKEEEDGVWAEMGFGFFVDDNIEPQSSDSDNDVVDVGCWYDLVVAAIVAGRFRDAFVVIVEEEDEVEDDGMLPSISLLLLLSLPSRASFPV
jgi:hypothetical protein